jgi:CDP-glycerol glycerophosphotransferase (TagB/SpsB family)
MTLNDCFDRADVLVSDISSVVTDFLHTERPIVISNPTSIPHDQFATTFPTQAASYVLDRDLASLQDLLADALGGDSLAEPRRAMKRYVLGDRPHGPLRAFRENVDRAYEEAAEHAQRVRNAFTVAHLDPHAQA